MPKLTRSPLNLAILLVALLSFVGTFGCSDELDPTAPDDAFYQFRDALLNGDEELMWERASESTHAYFRDRYEQLQAMDRKIERYLPQTDHKVAREQAGTVLLDEVDGPAGLFKRVVAPEKLEATKAQRIGAQIDTIRLSEDEQHAVLVTRSGQQFEMVRGEDDEWYVALAESTNAVDESFAWLENNQSALNQTVDDLIAEERQQREKVIAELMDLED